MGIVREVPPVSTVISTVCTIHGGLTAATTTGETTSTLCASVSPKYTRAPGSNPVP